MLDSQWQSWSELVFPSARQHEFIRDNIPVKKPCFESNSMQNENARLLRCFNMTFQVVVNISKCLQLMFSTREFGTP